MGEFSHGGDSSGEDGKGEADRLLYRKHWRLGRKQHKLGVLNNKESLQ